MFLTQEQQNVVWINVGANLPSFRHHIDRSHRWPCRERLCATTCEGRHSRHRWNRYRDDESAESASGHDVRVLRGTVEIVALTVAQARDCRGVLNSSLMSGAGGNCRDSGAK